MCIFPEGGLTRTGHVQTFQRGVERLMECSPETPIIPIYLDGLRGHPLTPNGKKSIRTWLGAWRHEVIVTIGDTIRGPIAASALRDRVLDLGSEAAELRKKPDCTLSHALVAAARRNWFRPAIADSTKKRLKFGEMLTAAVLIKNWLNREHAGEQNIGLLLPTSVGGALANFGVTLAGRAAVNLNFTAGEQNCRAAIEQCAIRTVLTSRKFIEKANLAAWPEMLYLEDLLPKFTRGAKIRAMLAGEVRSHSPDHRLDRSR